ncbi:protein of unknown function [Burkholderia multivorans]
MTRSEVSLVSLKKKRDSIANRSFDRI